MSDRSKAHYYESQILEWLDKLPDHDHSNRSSVVKAISKKVQRLRELEYLEERTLSESEEMMELCFDLGCIYGQIKTSWFISVISPVYVPK